jgi:hypothetical protein
MAEPRLPIAVAVRMAEYAQLSLSYGSWLDDPTNPLKVARSTGKQYSRCMRMLLSGAADYGVPPGTDILATDVPPVVSAAIKQHPRDKHEHGAMSAAYRKFIRFEADPAACNAFPSAAVEAQAQRMRDEVAAAASGQRPERWRASGGDSRRAGGRGRASGRGGRAAAVIPSEAMAKTLAGRFTAAALRPAELAKLRAAMVAQVIILKSPRVVVEVFAEAPNPLRRWWLLRQPGLLRRGGQLVDLAGGQEDRLLPAVNTVDDAEFGAAGRPAAEAFQYVKGCVVPPEIAAVAARSPPLCCDCGASACCGAGAVAQLEAAGLQLAGSCGCARSFEFPFDVAFTLLLHTELPTPEGVELGPSAAAAEPCDLAELVAASAARACGVPREAISRFSNGDPVDVGYWTQIENETLETVAALLGTDAVELQRLNAEWYPQVAPPHIRLKWKSSEHRMEVDRGAEGGFHGGRRSSAPRR